MGGIRLIKLSTTAFSLLSSLSLVACGGGSETSTAEDAGQAPQPGADSALTGDATAPPADGAAPASDAAVAGGEPVQIGLSAQDFSPGDLLGTLEVAYEQDNARLSGRDHDGPGEFQLTINENHGYGSLPKGGMWLTLPALETLAATPVVLAARAEYSEGGTIEVREFTRN